MSARVEHPYAGIGRACERCGLPPVKHRTVRREHAYVGEGRQCKACGLPPQRHRERSRRRGIAGNEPIVFIDGEGVGRDPHRYIYLAAADEDGQKRGSIEDVEGIRTIAAIEFLLSLRAQRLFGYGLGYDFSMWLRELPEEAIFLLCRPELRAYESGTGRILHRPIRWGQYTIGYLRGRLTIERVGAKVVVWDVWRFFQGKFTKALLDWECVTTEEERVQFAEIESMKALRAGFSLNELRRIEDYCDLENVLGARLVRRLVRAHDKAGLKLTSFYGAGSTAGALLNKLGVRESIAEPPVEARIAVASAYFGGWFEHSFAGPYEGTVENADISSAYPYQCVRLPCLHHGHWLFEKDRGLLRRKIRAARMALVYARAEACRGSARVWGPLSWRLSDGSIVHPLTNPGVWVWRDEFLAAEAFVDGVSPRYAWLYESDCDCRPMAGMAEYYRERLRIGKEGPGIVLKLGINGGYGRIAQSVGQPRFQSWVWAGAITSGCRAQLLTAIAASKDHWNVLGVATDGVFSKTKLSLPEPEHTGTAEVESYKGERIQKPLGGWEQKSYEGGVFFVRPGIYFGMTRDKLIRARGMSRSVLGENAGKIIDRWKEYGPDGGFRVEGLQRFVGMKTGVYMAGKKGVRSRAAFCQWVPYPVDVSFDPRPKRARILGSGRIVPFDRPEDASLAMRIPHRPDSLPYGPALNQPKKLSAEALALFESAEAALEQPDIDFEEVFE